MCILIIDLRSLVSHYFSQKERFGVVFGYLAKYHGRNWSILVIFCHFAVGIVFLFQHRDIEGFGIATQCPLQFDQK